MKKARQLAEKEEVSKTKGKGKMMKNLFTAILIAVVSTSVFAAEYYVYDYKASIKRLDYVLTTKKVSKVDTVIQKYKVASDTIKGYVVIPACIYCTTAQDGADTSIGMPSEGWFVRVGDKLSAKYGLPYVAHDSQVYVAAAKFGAYVTGSDNTAVDPKNNKSAWMKLGYALADNGNALDISAFLKKYSNDAIAYRFLGASNVDAGHVVNTGFGTVKSATETETSYDPCTGIESTSTTCDLIITITGTLCGGPTVDAMDDMDPLYAGLCNVTPMWDVCSDLPEYNAVICGTWTLKYNATLTKKYAAAGVDAIYDALKVTAEDVYEAR